MIAIKELSTIATPQFPDTWYEITTDGHFWLEWRFRAFLAQVRALGISLQHPWRGLDVGCGHGAVRRQLTQCSAWITDGADVSRAALAQNHACAGDHLLYDVRDRQPALAESYDFVLLFDVLEHVPDPAAFLTSALYHLKPGGWLFVDVPALNSLASGFDRAVGHLRRYNRRTLRADLDARALDVRDLRYWGGSMLPYLVARKVMTARAVPAPRVIECGLPPKPWMNNWICKIMAWETRYVPNPPIGTSLLAAAVKRPTGAGAAPPA